MATISRMGTLKDLMNVLAEVKNEQANSPADKSGRISYTNLPESITAHRAN